MSIWSNFALLVLQQVSFRLLAPTIGSSLETWSTIIGIFLLGIAAGNAAGGHLADRFSSGPVVRWGLLAGCATALAMFWISESLKQATWIAALPLFAQIAIAATLVCFLPAFLLSLLTPVAVRGVLAESGGAGSAAGLIYALGTVGSLIGNYATGFWMIPHYSIGQIILMVAGSLWLLALVVPATTNVTRDDLPASDDSVSTSDATPFAGRLALAAVVVAVCSFVSGTLESAAFRILAPLVGVSIYLSTGVVGVILCGIAVGNYWGGKIADRKGGVSALRWTLAVAAVATLLVIPLLKRGLDSGLLDGWSLIPKIVGWSFLLFFLPSLALGMISPQVIRLAIADHREAGRISGRLYAWSTVGCVVGILATAWCLIEWLGVQRLVLACGLGLLPIIAVVGRECPRTLFRQHKARIAFGSLLAAIWLWNAASPYALETRYFSIAVLDGERDGRQVKRLVLDRLVHSEVDLADPHWLGYPHEETQASITRNLHGLAVREQHSLEVLVIGGGGYTYPKWVEHQPDLRNVGLDVVEIDPGVTEIAYRDLGLSRDTRIRSFNLDGRQFVKSAAAGKYGLIIQDAVNDFSVPYHLMTREYNDLVRTALADRGVYLLTVIDSIQSGRFLPAALRTMRASFGDVRLLALPDHGSDGSRSLYIIAARNVVGDESAAVREAAWRGVLGAAIDRVVPDEAVAKILSRPESGGIILTDAYAPVDTLMSGAYLAKE